MSEPQTIQIGIPDEWSAFKKANPLFIERLPNLQAALNVAFARAVKDSDLLDRLVFLSGELCVEDFSEILLLCANGYGVGGLKLLRGMYERAVTAQYLHLHPVEADAFLAFHWVAMHRLTAAIQDTMRRDFLPEDKLKEVEENYRRVKDQFMVDDCKKCETQRLNYTWSKLDFVSMAKAAGGIGGLVVGAYSLPLLHAHSTAPGILSWLERSPHAGLTLDSHRGRQWAQTALITAHHVLLHVLELQKDRFKLESLGDPLQKCCEDFKDVWPKGRLDGA